MKNFVNNLTFLIALSVCVIAVSCSSDDEDDFGNKSKYSFVGKTYIEQYTLQNTSFEIQNIIHFITDSTFYYASRDLSKDDYSAGPKEGKYNVESDGTITFYGVSRFNTHIWSRRITLYKGKFKTEERTTLQVYRYLEFDTGNSRTDWVDYELK